MSSATILKATPDNIAECGKRIADGKLVAFPTETVYGLGANALDFNAVLQIYKTKERPLSDPVIVHISEFESSLPLIKPTEKEFKIYKFFADTFWPGPLTMVLRHSELIHPSMAANTGFVGIRMPDHKLALGLIQAAGVPIAAPSANMFNHVSPTTAGHVFNDFFDKDVTILDEGNSTLGIESTVMKITEETLYIYRLGSLPKSKIESVLAQSPDTKHLKIEVVKKIMAEHQEVVSPGTFIKHYSPKITSYLLTKRDLPTIGKASSLDLSEVCIVDFSRSLESLAPKVRAHFDLSQTASLKETMFKFYYVLREAENTEGCKTILIYDLAEFNLSKLLEADYLDCILDKMFRSCSGMYVENDL